MDLYLVLKPTNSMKASIGTSARARSILKNGFKILWIIGVGASKVDELSGKETDLSRS